MILSPYVSPRKCVLYSPGEWPSNLNMQGLRERFSQLETALRVILVAYSFKWLKWYMDSNALISIRNQSYNFPTG